jgi:hypothetical protein
LLKKVESALPALRLITSDGDIENGRTVDEAAGYSCGWGAKALTFWLLHGTSENAIYSNLGIKNFVGAELVHIDGFARSINVS